MHLPVHSILKIQTLLQLAKISKKVEGEGNEEEEEEEIVEAGGAGILGRERGT